MRRHATLLPLIFALTACDQVYAPEAEFDRGGYALEEVQSIRAAPAPMMADASEPVREASGADVAPSASFLAYRYNYQFALPSDAVKSVADRHAQACLDAGPTRCQILSRSTNDFAEDRVSAALSLRAEPAWLEMFTAQMTDSVEAEDGRLTGSNVYAEDLTRAILDTDARLKAQRTLRDRLTGLLETREAELADLLALERELARVQGEIESATSQLNALRQRVSMSVVDIGYETRRSAVSRSAFAPIGDALKDFVGTVASGLAAVIYFVAMLLPWLIFIGIPLVFALRWWARRRAARKRAVSES